ncbi:MAG: hypothetical protein QOD55_1843, partial [Solirubrobacteraceae bacterium]|nr:hypothetical protein [Solirubrobacteraceae bacterium]
MTRATARLAGLAATVAASAALAACGTEGHDLFVIQREGSVPAAPLTMRVTDDGRVSCNSRPLVDITSAQLIDARELQRDLAPIAARRLSLAPARGSVMRYRVVVEDGAVRFADNSRGQPAALFRLAKLTRDIARGPC